MIRPHVRGGGLELRFFCVSCGVNDGKLFRSNVLGFKVKWWNVIHNERDLYGLSSNSH